MDSLDIAKRGSELVRLLEVLCETVKSLVTAAATTPVIQNLLTNGADVSDL
jgi:hypothetical protein